MKDADRKAFTADRAIVIASVGGPACPKDERLVASVHHAMRMSAANHDHFAWNHVLGPATSLCIHPQQQSPARNRKVDLIASAVGVEVAMGHEELLAYDSGSKYGAAEE